VFQKMLENATRVCGANFGLMNLWDGNSFTMASGYNVPPAFAALRARTPVHPHPQSGLAAVVNTHQVAHIHDVRNSPAYLAGAPARSRWPTSPVLAPSSSCQCCGKTS
jgi:hypothetical protein